ncbi:MAG: hypothetical protein AAF602_29315 [Myxococcota bacterium]
MPPFPTLSQHDLERLERSENTAYALRSADWSLMYANAAWAHFAIDNDAPELATDLDQCSILERIAPPLREFYRQLFERVVASGVPEDHEYFCHSSQLHRRFRMRVTPIDQGVLIVHHRVVEHAHEAESRAPCDDTYVADDGFAVQCCHCRNTQRVHEPDTWDWVPAYLDPARPDVSHGLCPICFAHYFPAAARSYALERNRSHRGRRDS